jgi:hypothetical protein
VQRVFLEGGGRMFSYARDIAESMPYWMVDMIPLFLFIFASLFIFRLRSKRAVILLLTLSAMIVFYLSYYISVTCWADLKCSFSSQQEVCLANSYCNAREENGFALFLALIKAFVLWAAALKIYYLKSKFVRTKDHS